MLPKRTVGDGLAAITPPPPKDDRRHKGQRHRKPPPLAGLPTSVTKLVGMLYYY
jgi:hypothetical protein